METKVKELLTPTQIANFAVNRGGFKNQVQRDACRETIINMIDGLLSSSLTQAEPLNDEELKRIKGMCDAKADLHYTVPYDELSPEMQNEYEGIMIGWQECVDYFYTYHPTHRENDKSAKEKWLNSKGLYWNEKMQSYDNTHRKNEYTQKFIEWREKYFKYKPLVYEYETKCNKIYYTLEMILSRYKKAYKESPFKQALEPKKG